MLHTLLLSSRVHSALHHDSIVGPAPDHVLIEKEATRVARCAMDAVDATTRASMGVRRAGETTWTGRFGRVGAPPILRPGAAAAVIAAVTAPAPPSFGQGQTPGVGVTGTGIASRDLLTMIRQRNGEMVGEAGDDATGLARSLLAWMRQRGGRASSGDVIGAFEKRVKAGQTPLFKALLKEMCELRKGAKGKQGEWVLRAVHPKEEDV